MVTPKPGSDRKTYTVKMYCCREWPIDPLSPIGRCGYCGEKPTLTHRTLR